MRPDGHASKLAAPGGGRRYGSARREQLPGVDQRRYRRLRWLARASGFIVG